MELRQLIYFITISETKNFTRAAEKLFISQPALTKQINALESELDVRLFDRTNKAVTLTAAGRTFYLHATQVINEVNSTISHVNRLKSEEEARIHLALHPLLADWMLAPALKFFKKHYADRPVLVTVCGFEEQKSLLTGRKVDLALAVDHESAGLKKFIIAQLPMVVMQDGPAGPDGKNALWAIPGGCGYLSELLADEVHENGHCSVYTGKSQMESYLASGDFRVVCPAFAVPGPIVGAAGELSLRAGVFLMGDKALCAKFSPCAVSVLSCHTKEDLL